MQARTGSERTPHLGRPKTTSLCAPPSLPLPHYHPILCLRKCIGFCHMQTGKGPRAELCCTEQRSPGASSICSAKRKHHRATTQRCVRAAPSMGCICKRRASPCAGSHVGSRQGAGGGLHYVRPAHAHRARARQAGLRRELDGERDSQRARVRHKAAGALARRRRGPRHVDRAAARRPAAARRAHARPHHAAAAELRHNAGRRGGACGQQGRRDRLGGPHGLVPC